MRYRVLFTRHVQNDLENIKKADRDAIVVSLIELRKNPFSEIQLEGNFKGLFLYKVKGYKIVYEVYKYQLVVLVIKIGKKSEPYTISWLE